MLSVLLQRQRQKQAVLLHCHPQRRTRNACVPAPHVVSLPLLPANKKLCAHCFLNVVPHVMPGTTCSSASAKVAALAPMETTRSSPPAHSAVAWLRSLAKRSPSATKLALHQAYGSLKRSRRGAACRPTVLTQWRHGNVFHG